MAGIFYLCHQNIYSIVSNIKTECRNMLAFSSFKIGIALGFVFCIQKWGNFMFFVEILIGFSLIWEKLVKM